MISPGQKWHTHRKMITPTFHFKILDSFLEVFSEKSEILISKLRKEVGSKGFDMFPYITKCTLDIICGKNFTAAMSLLPVSVAARSKTYVCGRSLAGIVGSNPTVGMDVYLLIVVCCQVEVSATTGFLPTVVCR